MGTYSCTVRNRYHFWVVSELGEYVGQDTVLPPACLALEDAVPLGIAVWQFTQLGAGAQYAVNYFNETATLLLSQCKGSRVS